MHDAVKCDEFFFRIAYILMYAICEYASECIEIYTRTLINARDLEPDHRGR